MKSNCSLVKQSCLAFQDAAHINNKFSRLLIIKFVRAIKVDTLNLHIAIRRGRALPLFHVQPGQFGGPKISGQDERLRLGSFHMTNRQSKLQLNGTEILQIYICFISWTIRPWL
jgi:hypothetical protein